MSPFKTIPQVKQNTPAKQQKPAFGANPEEAMRAITSLSEKHGVGSEGFVKGLRDWFLGVRKADITPGETVQSLNEVSKNMGADYKLAWESAKSRALLDGHGHREPAHDEDPLALLEEELDGEEGLLNELDIFG